MSVARFVATRAFGLSFPSFWGVSALRISRGLPPAPAYNASPMLPFHDLVYAKTQSLVEFRRDLHRHPELGFGEFRTARRIAERLEALGLEVEAGVAQTGVVGRLRGTATAKSGSSPRTVLVRADIDALPIHEATGAEYASETPGVMHACGHDGHASIALHVAEVFAEQRAHFAGELRFAFQPAEEVVAGALPMIESTVFGAPLLEGVDAAIGLHLWNSQPVGWVSYGPGAIMASPDRFTVWVHGKGGHAAAPHQTIDPVLVAAHLITALQSLVSRETDPNQASVITIATLRAGEGAHNIIPAVAELRGTLRTFDQALRGHLRARIEALCQSLCAAFGARAELVWVAGPPPVVNDRALSERLAQMASGVAGVTTLDRTETTMGGDDMAEFLTRVPGVYFFVGSSDSATGRDAAHHHPAFDFDDQRALPLATELLARGAWELLGM
jgi:amidohydrolase